MSAAGCGNGVAELEEDCDDGNHAGGDGCSADCRLEPGGNVCAGVPVHSGARLALVEVASGLARPVYVTAPPDDVGRLFVVEANGRIRIVKRGRLLPTPFLDLSERIACCHEQGLLGLAFHTDYARNGEFFVDYTDVDGDTVVSRFRVSPSDPDSADPESEDIILQQEQPANIHNGGQLAFGPDGTLYIGFGDGGTRPDSENPAQNPDNWLGTILRVDVDGGVPFAVPGDNPFVGAEGMRDEIWVMGLRNPWRFSLDRVTGDLYIGDVGGGQWEEVDVQPAGAGGANYGWPIREGSRCFRPGSECRSEGLTPPVHEYEHGSGCSSITGGFVYRGCAMPDLHGTYFYGDFCRLFVRSFVYVDGVASDHRDWTEQLIASGDFGGISGFGEDARGELHVCELSGRVHRIVPGS